MCTIDTEIGAKICLKIKGYRKYLQGISRKCNAIAPRFVYSVIRERDGERKCLNLPPVLHGKPKAAPQRNACCGEGKGR